MPALVEGIHDLTCPTELVDARRKAGHDGTGRAHRLDPRQPYSPETRNFRRSLLGRAVTVRKRRFVVATLAETQSDPLALRIREALAGPSVVLVGMMGAGKSSVGRRLAIKLGLPFSDADAELEKA